MTKSPLPICDVLLLGAFVELVVGDAFAVLEPVDAADGARCRAARRGRPSCCGVLDAEHGEAARVDQLGVVAVVGLVLVEDVAERIPMRRALHAEVQRVVGVADLVPVLLAGDGVGAGREHLVDRIEAAAEQAGLRAVAVERNAEREHLAGADQARRLDDVLGRDVVERPDLVVLAPAAPVPKLLGRFPDRLLPDLDIHASRPLFPVWPVLQSARILTAHSGRVHAEIGVLQPSQRPQNLVRRERHVGQRRRAERAQRIVDGVHHRSPARRRCRLRPRPWRRARNRRSA